MTIAELNSRILIKAYSVSQNEDTGDIETALADSWEKSAKVEQDDGTLLMNNGMESFNESYKITMRFENSRPTKANYEIEYKTKVLKIYNVKANNEGNERWEVIRAYTSN